MDTDTIGSLFINSLKNCPNNCMVIDKGIKYTYEDIARYIAGFQLKFLEKMDIIPQIVAFKLDNSVEYIVTYFGLTLLGIVIQPIYSNSSNDEVEKLLSECGTDTIICDRHICVKNILNVVNFDELRCYSKKNKLIYSRVNPNDVGILLTSSGTTNNPKIIAHSHFNMIKNCEMNAESICLKEGSLGLATLPLAFGYANMMTLLSHVYVCGGIVLYKELNFVPKVYSMLEKYQIFDFVAVPAILRGLTYFCQKKGKYICNNELKKIFFGGGGITELEYKNFCNILTSDANLIQTYGCTECGPRISTKIIGEDYEACNLGKPIEGIEIKLFNPDKDGWGEIGIKTPTKMLGYIINGKLQASTGTYFYPGDICKINNKGEIIFRARKGNIVKYLGFNISLEDIESYVYRSVGGKYIVRAGVKDNDLFLDVQTLNMEIMEKINEVCMSLPMYKRPKVIKRVEKIEMTNNNKVKRVRY